MPNQYLGQPLLKLGRFTQAVSKRLQSWQSQHLVERIWSKDFRVWSPVLLPEIIDRLGWLDLPERMKPELEAIKAAASSVKEEGIQRVVLLGMGGSSLAPQVFHSVFGRIEGWPDLVVLDTTHPDEISDLDEELDYERTIFIVASKSGTTQETISLFQYFFNRADKNLSRPEHQFVAITDQDSPLHETARKLGFRHIFLAPSDVGGRYSALAHFGLVPAAFVGLDLDCILKHASEVAALCRAGDAGENNPGLYLGAALAELALAGIDKVTFITDQRLRLFPDWIEQLIAESTGKDGKGIVPVTGEVIDKPDNYGSDRFFIGIWLENSDQASSPIQTGLEDLARAGHPTCFLRLTDRYDLSGHMYVWEFAVAAACSALRVNAFDQPDVQLAKDLARKAITQRSTKVDIEDEIHLSSTSKEKLAAALESLLSSARSNDYFGIQAYLERNDSIISILGDLRQKIRHRLKVATTLGFGPRFLHSSGQLHKGGPDTGIFLQLVDQPTVDLPIPESGITFGHLIRAQAIGDYLALKERSRRILRIDLGTDPITSLESLVEMVQ